MQDQLRLGVAMLVLSAVIGGCSGSGGDSASPAAGSAEAAKTAGSGGSGAASTTASDGGTHTPGGTNTAKKDGQVYLEMSTPVGPLRYLDITPGSGAVPEPGKKVSVHYKAWLGDGKLIDERFSRESGKKYEYEVGKTVHIKGWEHGISTLKVGGKRKLFLSPELGYGRDSAAGQKVPPNSELIYEVELLALN